MHGTRWMPPEVEHIRPDKRRAKSFDDLPQTDQLNFSESLSTNVQFFNRRETIYLRAGVCAQLVNYLYVISVLRCLLSCKNSLYDRRNSHQSSPTKYLEIVASEVKPELVVPASLIPARQMIKYFHVDPFLLKNSLRYFQLLKDRSRLLSNNHSTMLHQLQILS
jgi:hypothetical protein